ncbi:anti-sigma factor [Streptomyces sp. NPDC056773]|uniref:anti-sigma factor n=1 Tax=unclassified Streptomyces TaxID=2593676 RepID=UPI003677DB2B
MNRIDGVRQLPPPTRAERPVRMLSAFMRRIGPLAVAASIAAAACLGTVAIWQHRQVEQARTQARSAQAQVREFSAVLSAPDTRTVHGRTSTGATTSVATSARLNKSVFAVTGLAPAPAGKTYQLWFDDNGTMRPAGLVHHDGTVLMQGDPSRARAVGLTLEPDGGSPQPTTSPLLLLNLPA